MAQHDKAPIGARRPRGRIPRASSTSTIDPMECECGRQILTVAQVAEKLGLQSKAITQAIYRGTMDPEPWGTVAGRPVWLSTQFPGLSFGPEEGDG